MIFIFILESIGTPELILIAVVALIVFGPRKLPGMAKTIGKTMAEFRKATNEFKTTWEKEATLDKEFGENGMLTETAPVNALENKILPEISEEKTIAPQVKQLSQEEINQIFLNKKNDENIDPIKTAESADQTTAANPQTDKRNWL